MDFVSHGVGVGSKMVQRDLRIFIGRVVNASGKAWMTCLLLVVNSGRRAIASDASDFFDG